MYDYTFAQWLFFFYFYCFFGWCFESTYVSINDKKLTNRGFMRGPFLPLYGTGAIMMLVVSMPFQDNILLTYLAGCFGATVLEYITGVTMEALFKVRYWDYSDKKFNFKGHICLSSTLVWGLLTILMTRFVHQPLAGLFLKIPLSFLNPFIIVLSTCILLDFAISFKAAIDLRDILVKMEQAKREMQRLQKRLDVMIAVTGEGMGNKMSAAKDSIKGGMANAKETFVGNMSSAKDTFVDGMTNAKEGFMESFMAAKDGLVHSAADMKKTFTVTFNRYRAILSEDPDSFDEEIKTEVEKLNTEFSENSEKHEKLSSLKDFFQRSLIRANPGMTSVEFQESLEELKESVYGKRNQ